MGEQAEALAMMLGGRPRRRGPMMDPAAMMAARQGARPTGEAMNPLAMAILAGEMTPGTGYLHADDTLSDFGQAGEAVKRGDWGNALLRGGMGLAGGIDMLGDTAAYAAPFSGPAAPALLGGGMTAKLGAKTARKYLAERLRGAPNSLKKNLPKSSLEGVQRLAAENRLASGAHAHDLEVEKGTRASSQGRLTAAEKKMYPTKELQAEARKMRGRFPRNPTFEGDEGWRGLEFAGTDKKSGKVKAKKQSYNYHLGDMPEGDRIEHLSDELAHEIATVQQRAANGDKAAETIMAQKGWYRAMRGRLRQEFGGAGDVFSDLLGALSPNTGVEINFRNAVEAVGRFTRGDYDDVLREWRAHREAGGTVKGYDGPMILKEDEKLFGINSANAMDALTDLWRRVEVGSAPKAKNFSANLIGLSDTATIDVWAARTLTRLAGMQRVPIAAEKAVTGKVGVGSNASGSITGNPEQVGGEFGFGQDVFAKAADKLGMEPDELQAVAWFMEKERWFKNGWTSNKDGSFEQQLDYLNPQRYQAGVSATEVGTPTNKTQVKFQDDISELHRNDPTVIVDSQNSTLGRYGPWDERSFDLELTTTDGFDVGPTVQRLAEWGKHRRQDDVFVSRVLKTGEKSDNARPGMEIYFDTPKTLDEISEITSMMDKKYGDSGWTMITDRRMAERDLAGKTAEKFTGIRMQYVPEISMRFDDALRKELTVNPNGINPVMSKEMDRIVDMLEDARQFDGVTYAQGTRYDTIVMGKENYDDFIGISDPAGVPGGSASAGRGSPWFGEQVSDHVAAAARRIEQASGLSAGGGPAVRHGKRPPLGPLNAPSKQTPADVLSTLMGGDQL